MFRDIVGGVSVSEVEKTPFASFKVGPEGRVLDYSGVSLRDLGLEADRVLGVSLLDLWSGLKPLIAFCHRILAGEMTSLTVRVSAASIESEGQLHRLFATPIHTVDSDYVLVNAFLVRGRSRLQNRAVTELIDEARSDVDITQLLEKAVALLREFEQIDFAHAIQSDDSLTFRSVAAAGWPKKVIRQLRDFSWNQTAEELSFNSNSEVSSEDIWSDDKFAIHPALRAAGARSCLCVPILAESECIAVLGVYSKQPAAFLEDHTTFVNSIANVLSQTIQSKTTSERDALTNAFNRRRFQDALAQELSNAVSTGRNGAILFTDIDDFKAINDSLGHSAGDKFLVSLTHCLSAQIRDKDLLARLGGDEFAVLLRDVGSLEALRTARRLLDAVREHRVIVENRALGATISIGIALFPGQSTDPNELLAFADLAMYSVKQSGRNDVSLYNPKDNEKRRSSDRLLWKQRIPEALAGKGFLMFAQPIVELRTGEVRMQELLIRFKDEHGEIILPSAFLKIAEVSGLMRDIDRWALRQAVALCLELQNSKEPVDLTLNLSGMVFGDDEFLNVIQRELLASQIDPARLCVEITESAAVSDLRRAQRFLEKLRGFGVKVALDDFGVGFSSFSHLKNLPVDYLKIDGSFIEALPANKTDQHFVRAIGELAKGLDIELIAEYVQDVETAQLLTEFGVRYGQGFYFGRPVPLLEAFPYIQRAAA